MRILKEGVKGYPLSFDERHGKRMYIIAGLGNPTREYAGTRHNIGFDTITHISDKYGIPLNKKEHKAVCGSGYIDGMKVILLQPQTYMNLSGESIREFVDFYKIDPEEELIVVYDDVSLEPGNIRVRPRGSAGGHNGMKNIILNIGTQNFTRVRVGVGAKPEGWDLADHVLSHFPKDTEPVIREAMDKAADAVVCIMNEGVESSMNRFNEKSVK